MRSSFDYVVVGAGSAGAILAARLSEDPAIRVLLLEAGPPDKHWTIHMPGALGINDRGGRYTWSFETVPQPHLDGRRIFHPRGKTLGGSSAINGMAYIRGHALDYDRWVDEGCAGWSYADVLPYFRRNEAFQSGADAYRGGDGPVRTHDWQEPDPLDDAFLAAGCAVGYPVAGDVNAYQQEGFGRFSCNIDRGVRASTAHAYLRPARGRANLTVATEAQATTVVVEHCRAVGVVYRHGGREHEARAEREVIVSAGAVGTPHLLMLSGVGPADHLRAHGIAVRHDLRGVGRNLQDHLELHLQWLCPLPVTLDRYLRPPRKWIEGARWFLSRTGMCAFNGTRVGAFLRTRAGVRHPDAQIHFIPVYLDDWLPTGRKQGFCLCIGTLRAASRGTITLSSADPMAAPLIDPNYLSEEADRRDLRDCLPLAREVVAQAAFDPYRGTEDDPGQAVRSEAEIDAYVRRKASTAFHLAGTCKMGVDAEAVVDAAFRVHGLEGLRVVDASAMSSIISGNLNATVMMMSEKAADMILGRPPLPPSNAPFHVAPNWQTAQR